MAGRPKTPTEIVNHMPPEKSVGSLVWVRHGHESWPAVMRRKADFELEDYPGKVCADAVCVQYLDAGNSVSLVDPKHIEPLHFRDPVANERRTKHKPDITAALNRAATLNMKLARGQPIPIFEQHDDSAAAATDQQQQQQQQQQEHHHHHHHHHADKPPVGPVPDKKVKKKPEPKRKNNDAAAAAAAAAATAAAAPPAAPPAQQQQPQERTVHDLSPADRRRLNELVTAATGQDALAFNLLAPPPPRPPPPAAAQSPQTGSTRRQRGIDDHQENGPARKENVADRTAAAKKKTRKQQQSWQAAQAAGEKSAPPEYDGEVTEWDAELAGELLQPVATQLEDLYEKPRVIGAYTFDGCVGRGGGRVRLNLPAGALADNAGTGADLADNAVVLLVPFCDSEPERLATWCEPITLGRHREARFAVDVNGVEFAAPRNWAIPASKQDVLAPARIPIPLNITEGVRVGVRKKQSNHSVALFLSGLEKWMRNVNVNGDDDNNSDDDDDDDSSDDNINNDDFDMEWVGSLAAVLCDRQRSTAEIQARMERVNAVFPVSETFEYKIAVSAACPMTSVRIDVPVRSSQCSHLQCLDAVSVIISAVQSRMWVCNYCGASAPLTSWGVDYDLQRIMRLNPNVQQFFAIRNEGRRAGDDSPTFTYEAGVAAAHREEACVVDED